MRKSPLHVSTTQDTTGNTLYITWCLLNVNNICDLLTNTWRTTEGVIHGVTTLSLYCYKIQTQNFHPVI